MVRGENRGQLREWKYILLIMLVTGRKKHKRNLTEATNVT
jgi:hypothetical protein